MELKKFITVSLLIYYANKLSTSYLCLLIKLLNKSKSLRIYKIQTDCNII